MGAPSIPKPLAAPPTADTTKAQLSALAYAETQRRLRESQGRKGSFVTTRGDAPKTNGRPFTNPPQTVSVLGA